MSYLFGIVRRVEANGVADRLDRLARTIDPQAGYISHHPPGTDTRGWFYCPNRGHPFDDNLAREVRSAVAQAGLGWIWAP